MGAVISIDFDGTVVEHAFPDIGSPIKIAIKTVEELYLKGHQLVLNTCREGVYLDAAKHFLMQQCILHCFSTFNENIPERIAQYNDCRKIGADYYIDDRGCFGNYTIMEAWNDLRREFDLSEFNHE